MTTSVAEPRTHDEPTVHPHAASLPPRHVDHTRSDAHTAPGPTATRTSPQVDTETFLASLAPSELSHALPALGLAEIRRELSELRRDRAIAQRMKNRNEEWLEEIAAKRRLLGRRATELVAEQTHCQTSPAASPHSVGTRP